MALDCPTAAQKRADVEAYHISKAQHLHDEILIQVVNSVYFPMRITTYIYHSGMSLYEVNQVMKKLVLELQEHGFVVTLTDNYDWACDSYDLKVELP